MTDKEKISAIKAEIERRIQECKDSKIESSYYDGLIFAFKEVRDFIDSLPEEPVSEDLEEAMNRAADETRLAKAKNGQPFFSEVDFNLGFSNGAQWQKQQTVDKACEWLHRNIDSGMWLARFRKIMEE